MIRTETWRRHLARFVLLAGITLAAIPLSGGPDIRSHADGGTISADLLRHPISEKARGMLRTALGTINSGNHDAAIQQLLDTLAKYPESAAYAHSLLGVEYLRVDRFNDAVESFEKAVLLLPHDAINRYNLGLSLVCTGDYKRGEQEVRRALEVDPKNATMQAFMSFLLQRKRAATE